jgi:hypothetical protein
MRTRVKIPGSALALAASLSACSAQRPQVYLGETPTSEAQAKVDADVEYCLDVGTRYGSASGTGRAGGVARDTAVGGAAGAAAGAAGGAVAGNAGRGAATGAAAGAAWHFMTRILRPPDPDPVYRAAVQQCLADRGHRVLAWK